MRTGDKRFIVHQKPVDCNPGPSATPLVSGAILQCLKNLFSQSCFSVLNSSGALLKAFPIRVHGLKRIWEFLDLNTDDLDLKLITDTKLLAYLLDPDAGEINGLTLTHLAYQYLGEEYPHVASEVQDKGVIKAQKETLMRDAQIIWHLSQELGVGLAERL